MALTIVRGKARYSGQLAGSHDPPPFPAPLPPSTLSMESRNVGRVMFSCCFMVMASSLWSWPNQDSCVCCWIGIGGFIWLLMVL